MNDIASRKITQFRDKLQCSIDVADDEINRLQLYLQNLNSELANLTERLIKFENQFKQDHYTKKGKIIREKTKIDAILARMASDHHQKINNLIKTHTTNLEQLEADYERALEETEEYGRKQCEKELNDLDTKIINLKRLLYKKREKLQFERGLAFEDSNIDNETLYLTKNRYIEEEKIKHLERTLHAKQEDRLEQLNKLKDQLFQAVHTFESMEEDHNVKMHDYELTLKEIDESYEESVRELKKDHMEKSKPVLDKIKNVNKKCEQLQQRIESKEEEQQRKLNQLLSEREEIQSGIDTENKRTVISKTFDENHDAQVNLNSIKLKYEKLTNEADQIRYENQELKRERARLQHIIKMSRRRASIGLDSY